MVETGRRSAPDEGWRPGLRGWVTRAASVLSAHEPVLWTVAVGALLLDLWLTVLGLQLGLQEQNWLALGLLARFGVVGLGLIKAAAVGVGLVGRALLPKRYVCIVPLALAVPWFVAGLVNLGLVVARLVGG